MEPSSQDRIQRMEADGVLTPGQAEMLRDSLAGPAGGAGTGARPGRRRLPAWLTWGLPAALGLGLAVALLIVVPLLIWTFLRNSLVAKEERVFEGLGPDREQLPAPRRPDPGAGRDRVALPEARVRNPHRR